MADLVYTAELNNKQVLDALKSIDSNIDKMAKSADKSFQNTGKAAESSGVQIGTVAGIVTALATEFIRLGEQAISALIDIGKQSVETAIQMDTLKARLGGIFDGSKEAADEAFTFIQDKSQELGIDLSELAGAFLPKTESLDQFERVAKIATALARSDPEQGAIGARIALIEALSGTFTSLQRRFEIPKSDIENIKEAFDKEGIEGFLEAIETTLAASGKSFDDLANTAQTSFSKLQIAGEQILGRLGVPIVESLEQASSKILDFINANEDELIVFADTIGRAIADAIDFLSSIDLGQLDTDQLLQFADYVYRIVGAVQLVTGQLTGWLGSIYQTIDAIGPLGETLNYLWSLFTNIDDALVTLSQILALSKAGWEGLYAGIQPLLPLLESLFSAFAEAATGDFLGAATAIGDAVNSLSTATFDQAAAQKAAQESLTESAKAFDEYNKSIEGNKDSQQSLREELEKQKAAGTDAADAILGAAQAQRELEEAGTAAAEAQAKINEAMAKAELDFQRNLEDIDIETARKRLDILEDFADKRIDAARKNAEEIADIERKNEQDIQDAKTDKARSDRDAQIKLARAQLDQAKDEAQKQIDIEVDYRRKLADIRTQFELDAEEAEQNRDAVAFIRALKRQNEEIQQAETERQQAIEDARSEGEARRAELQQQFQFELIDNTIAYNRKREDLNTALARQLEDQRIAYAREQEELAINEERKLEELATNRQRDIEDAQRAYERKLEDLQASLEAEYALIQEYNALLEAEALRHAEAMAAANALASEAGASAGGIAPGITGGGSRGPGGSNIPNKPLRDIPGFAEGGVVPGPMGQPRLVLAHAGEVITPPGEPVLMPTFGGGMGGSVTNSRQTNVNLPLATPEQILSPFLMAQIRNMMVRTLGDVN